MPPKLLFDLAIFVLPCMTLTPIEVDGLNPPR